MLLDFWNEFVRSKLNDDKQPRFLVGWALGHKDADMITLMEDGRNDANLHDHELQSALTKMKNTKPKVQGCLACENGSMSIMVGNTRSNVDKQVFPLS